VQIISSRADLPFRHVKNSRLCYYLGSETDVVSSENSTTESTAEGIFENITNS
jgi:hypothetical protein